MIYALPIIKRKVLYALIRNVTSMSKVSILTATPLDKLRNALLRDIGASFEYEYRIVQALETFQIQRDYYEYLVVEAAKYCEVYAGEMKFGKKIDGLSGRKLLDHDYSRWEAMFYPMCKRNYLLDRRICKSSITCSVFS